MSNSLVRKCAQTLRRPARQLRNSALTNETLFRLYLRSKYGTPLSGDWPLARPTETIPSGVLQSNFEWRAARSALRKLGLPRHHDGPKNWDTLAALTQILSQTTRNAKVLDAGAELYSALLPALYAYGYRNLTGINLVFSQPILRGPIRYEHGDITATQFEAGHFDAIASLSVIEHGVDLRKFFAEMARILRPGGVLVVSTDYWNEPVDTEGKIAFGAPIHVFSRQELSDTIETAHRCGLELETPFDFRCNERTVHWEGYDLDYTFAVMTFRRSGRATSTVSPEIGVPVSTANATNR